MILGKVSFRCAAAQLELYSIKYVARDGAIEMKGKWMGWLCKIFMYLDLNFDPRSRIQTLIGPIYLNVEDSRFWEDEEGYKVEGSTSKELTLWRQFLSFMDSLMSNKRTPAQVLSTLESFKVS